MTERHDARRARRAEGLLAAFNTAGVLHAADVHVAQRLHRMVSAAAPDEVGPGTSGASGGDGEATRLGCALAVRAPRLGHVCVDLATAPATVTSEADDPVDLGSLPWPEPASWLAALEASPLVGNGDDAAPRPLRLIGTRLYLDRYWREEGAVAADLLVRTASPAEGVDADVLRAGLARLFSDGSGGDAAADPLQRLAAATAVLRRLTVIAGGPGTGKTTTVARILALLLEQAAARGAPPPRIALAAPTGKAAARLEEAVHAAATDLPIDEAARRRLRSLEGSTLHRLLGWRPDHRGRFRHHRGNRLPQDVVVVDETSMVSLSLMARLVEAARPSARLVLVGDHEQLASVEAGAVLGDVVGPAGTGLRVRPAARAELVTVLGADDGLPEADPSAAPIGDGIVVLRRVFRHGGGIAALARAVQVGDADEALRILRGGRANGDLSFIAVDPAASDAGAALAPVRAAVVGAGRRVVAAARAGDAAAALDALSALRLLCAHRRGAHGVEVWEARVERWLAEEIDGYGAGGRWYPGRPVLVTANDHALRLYNGDTGVVVAREGGVRAVFARRGGVVEVAPTRLSAVEGVHAMTVHKSQGSQFTEVAVLLPDASSPLLTRELLYTALTRARRRLTLVGTEAAVRTAIARPIARASGLREALWGLTRP